MVDRGTAADRAVEGKLLDGEPMDTNIIDVNTYCFPKSRPVVAGKWQVILDVELKLECSSTLDKRDGIAEAVVNVPDTEAADAMTDADAATPTPTPTPTGS